MNIVASIVIALVCAAVVVLGLRWSSRRGRQVDLTAAMGAAVIGLMGLPVLVNDFQAMAGFVLMCLALVGLIAWGILYIAVPGWLQRPVRSTIIWRHRRNSTMPH
jgi:hypothetical protein